MNDHSTDRRNALYPWFEESGAQLVHPEDFESFKALMPYGRVFEIGGAGDGYVCLRYGAGLFRVKADLLKEVPQVRYRIGDKVEIKGKDEAGEIIDVMWHYKEAKPFFQITVDGKKRSKRYWESDFIPVS